MQRFLKQLLVFSTPVLILLYPMDLLLSKLLKETSLAQGEYEVWNDILSSSIDANVAIYGSSRAWVHIDPKIIEDSLNLSAYNLGMDGLNLWSQTFRHDQYLANNSIPQVIIHSLDLFSLGQKTCYYNNDQFLPYMLWNKDFTGSPNFPAVFNKYENCIPMLRYQNRNNLIISAIRPIYRKEAKRNKGFEPQHLTWNTDFQLARKNKDSFNAEIYSSTIDLFKKYLQNCKQKDIKVILVYSPEYIEGQYYTKNRDEIINVFMEIANEFNLLFLDYSTHEICLNKKYFYNATHLNATGANLFSRTLARDLKQLIYTKENVLSKH